MLPQQHAVTVVHATRQQKPLPQRLEQVIIDKAQGNPFFLEELTRAVIEHEDTITSIDVPDTIQGVLSARIDQLPEEHKRLLQTASVLGRTFSPTLLAQLWEGKAPPAPLLADLKRLEFLYERPGTAEAQYVFKHALTQDVAYESLLTTRRHALHAAAGLALELLYADHLEDAHEQVAYHYARTDHTAKAVQYLTLVAEKAMRGYAHVEAMEILRETLSHAERLPAAERAAPLLELVLRQAESLFRLGRRQEAVAILVERHDLLPQLPSPLLRSRYYAWLGHTYAYLGIREQASLNGQRALAEASQCGDTTAMGRAYAMLGQEAFFAGAIPQAITYCQSAVAQLEPTQEHYWLGLAFQNLGIGYCLRGELRLAVETYRRLETLAQAIGDQRLRNNAVALMGWSYAMQGEGAMGIATCERAFAYAPDAFETAFTTGLAGYAYLAEESPKAVPMLEQAVEQAKQYRSRQVQSWFHTFLGEAYGMREHMEKAGDLARQGLHLAETVNNPWGVGIAQRALGRIAHRSGNLTEAENLLQKALSVFKGIQAQYELARTHLDLAALAHAQGNRNTATEYLSTASAWFQKLHVPKWVEQTERLARKYDVRLTEVALELEGDL
jgi:tetratricopeptide (TPR) repeat protein